jgi:UDP-N-acetylglucosamine 2-epimerase (non-hydrolysing)
MPDQPLRIAIVVGTRPNFMKALPLVRALRARPEEFHAVLIHTGQHYDDSMSKVFFDQLGVGRPDHFLDARSGSQARQTAKVMTALEPLLEQISPDAVLVSGDVNSTLAAALVASKLGVPIGHVEAGLRSFDRTMPEEINRILTDAMADMLFTHSPEARDHLLAEGRRDADIYAVGNTMIDTLVAMREAIARERMAARFGLEPGGYLVVTLHRPALVDGDALVGAFAALDAIAATLPVVFPIHPRTRKEMMSRGVDPSRVTLVEPLGYVEFLSLVADARGVLTDSGGIQEETTFLGIPCFTLRENTERPITCSLGTNVLLGLRPERIREVPGLIDSAGSDPPLLPGWDGHAAERIVDVLATRRPLAGFASAADGAPASATRGEAPRS